MTSVLIYVSFDLILGPRVYQTSMGEPSFQLLSSEPRFQIKELNVCHHNQFHGGKAHTTAVIHALGISCSKNYFYILLIFVG